MLRSIDFKTMPYLFTDKAGTCLTVEFDGRELDDIYKQVKAMYDQAHSSDDMPTEPGWYATRDGEDLLSYDGDAWHIHNIDCDAQLFADGDLETMDWSVVKRTFDADAFPLIPVNLNDTSRAERRLTNLTNFLHTLIHECETVRDNPSSDTVYRLQCPRGHISTSWFSHAALASRQWKELVDEYKGKDTK